MANNDKIKSVYDPKLMKEKRLKSAQSMLEKLKDDSDFILVDKSRTFFGVKASKDNGYYAIQKNPKDETKLICNCFDYAHYIEVNPDHECKHILAVNQAVKDKTKLAVKDLTGLLTEDTKE